MKVNLFSIYQNEIKWFYYGNGPQLTAQKKMFKTFGRTRVACDILVAYSNIFIWSNFPTNKKSFDSPENYQNAIDFDCIASETTRKKNNKK